MNRLQAILGIFYILTIVCIPFLSATEFGYNYLDQGSTVINGANYSINVNNTNYFQGYTPTTLKDWIQGFFDSVYYSIGNPFGYYNSTTLDLTPYVPYLNATQNLNLGTKNLYSFNTNRNQYVRTFEKSLITNGTPSIQSNAIYTNGVTDYLVSQSATNDFDVSTNDFSIGIWFNTNSTANGYIAGQGNPSSSNGRGFAIRKLSTNNIALIFNNGTGSAEGVAYNGGAGELTGGWKHIMIVTNRITNEMKVYLNGELKTTASIVKTGSFAHATKNMAIGRSSAITGVYFEGLTDSFVFYKNKTLTDVEVLTIYQSGRGYSPIQNGITAQYTGLDYEGTTTTPTLFYNTIEQYPVNYQNYWKQGNVVYVPLDANINDYISNSKNGDTLVLSSGTYNISTAIIVSKSIAIKGQGVDKTIINGTSDTVFSATLAPNVEISDLTLKHTFTGSTGYGFILGDSTKDVLNGILIENIKIEQIGVGSTAGYGIRFGNTNGVARNIDIISSGSNVGYGITQATYASATVPAISYIDNIRMNLTAISTAYGVYVFSSSATNNSIAYITNSNINVYGASGQNRGIFANTAQAYAYATNNVISGTTADIIQGTSATLQSINNILLNNLITGTITYAGTLRNNQGYFNSRVSVGGGTFNTAIPFGVYGSTFTPYSGGYPMNFELLDNRAMAQDVGGGIVFGGNDGSITNRWFSGFHGGKENGVSGDYAGYLSLHTRVNGGAVTEKVRISSAGDVGIGTTAPTEKLEIDGNLFLNGDNRKLYLGAGKDFSAYYDGTNQRFDLTSGDFKFNAGVIITDSVPLLITDNLTDSTAKIGRFGVPHYNNSEEPIALLWGQGATANSNIVNIGGGTSAMNAVTNIRFFTTPLGNTVTGTERMRIGGSGNVLIGTTTDTGATLQVNGTVNATSLIAQNGFTGSCVNVTYSGGIAISCND